MLMVNGEHPDVYVHFETQAKKQIKAKKKIQRPENRGVPCGYQLVFG